jgi:hypothetical protein
MNWGIPDGLHPDDQSPIRQGLCSISAMTTRGGTTAVGTPLIPVCGATGTNTTGTAATMNLGLTYLPDTWLITEVSSYYNAVTAGTLSIDVVIYECLADGLPGRLVTNGIGSLITSGAGVKVATGYELSVPYSGWYWAGIFLPTGAQITQHTMSPPIHGIAPAISIGGSFTYGLEVNRIPAAYTTGIAWPDLTAVPLGTSGATNDPNMYHIQGVPYLVVRGA